MYQKTIFEEALRRIQERRTRAQEEQEQRSDRIRKEIPETAELDNQLRSACMSIVKAFGAADSKERLKKIAQHCEGADIMLRQILQAHNYPANYLDTQYSCTACFDTGFVDGRPCECLKREIGLIGAEQLNAQSQLSLCSFHTFSLSYYNNLPWDQQQIMARIYQQCHTYAETFDPESSGNILMIGNTGLGKTHLSLSIAADVLESGFSVIYDSAGSMLHKLEREHFGNDGSNDTLDMLLECDLLILDDFGTEFDTSFTRSMIYTIINSRINSTKPFIVNTNLSKEELQAQYGNRILSRLFSACIMQFYGTDIRFQKSIQQNRS